MSKDHENRAEPPKQPMKRTRGAARRRANPPIVPPVAHKGKPFHHQRSKGDDKR